MTPIDKRPTPRTDALELELLTEGDEPTVMHDLARTLERENAALREALDNASGALYRGKIYAAAERACEALAATNPERKT